MNARRNFLRGLGAAAAIGATASAQTPPAMIRERQSFKTITLDFLGSSIVGPIIGAAYPQLQLLDTIKFQRPFQIIGFDLNASFFAIEGNGASVSGIFLVIGKDEPNAAVDQSLQSLGSVLCNPLQATEAATPPTVPLFFDEDFCYPLPANAPLSLYGCNVAVQTRLQAITAIANVYLAEP